MTAPRMALVNQRTDEALADRIELAVTRNDRRKGLLGREVFETSSALIIAPCFSIHTMFMRFDIDAVFVDDDGLIYLTDRHNGGLYVVEYDGPTPKATSTEY